MDQGIPDCRILFLDIDGVICLDQVFDKACCDRIKRILDATGAKIVISSAWRVGHSLESLRKIIARGYEVSPIPVAFRENIGTLDPDSVIGVTPSINKLPRPGAPFGRGLEISVWLERHPGVMKYIVLDDEAFDIDPHRGYLVKTNPLIGITDKDVEKAIILLS
jgi:hypothetical protein